MQKFLSPIALIFLFIVGCSTQKDNQQNEWVSLFNGENLDGWKIKIVGNELNDNFKNTFRVQDGILSVRYDQYDSFRNTFGAIFYDKAFTNYRLRAEYRFVGDTAIGAPSWGYRDSGIMYHSQSPTSMGINQNFPICLEYNLHGGNGVDERPNGELCTIGTYVEIDGKRNESFCTTPIVKKTFHGDQWVTLEIEIKDGKITHFVSGEEILQFANPRYDTTNAVSKTLRLDGGDSIQSGYIALQSNSHPIDFRKIEILEY